MKTSVNRQYGELLEKVTVLLKDGGLTTGHAQLAAEAICSASLRGTDSHGIRLLPHYLEALQAGRIDPAATFEYERTSPSTAILDANHGMAHAAVATAMDYAIELAKESGAGFVSVKNSNHCGAMAYYGLRAARQDMIGIVTTNTTPKIKVHNARAPYFGTNPICVTAPMAGEDPFCFDASPAVMSSNKIKMLKASGDRLPGGVAADPDGNETHDAGLAKMLLPLGGLLSGYKGYGISMVVDILSSLLSGMPAGKDVTTMYSEIGEPPDNKRYLGQFVGAIRISSFVDVSRFKERLSAIAQEIRRLPQALDAEDEVMIAGDPEKRATKLRKDSGIPVPYEVDRLLP